MTHQRAISTSDCASARKPHARGRGITDTFERKTFSISRLAEFVSESELVKQIGHPVRDWPLVIVKELVDNALDEAEEAGSPPTIQIQVDAPEDEPVKSLSMTAAAAFSPRRSRLIDYSARTSSRAAYASPTRGAQGNALQTIVAMPYALAGEDCETVLIESHGVEHRISFTTDPIRQTPRPVIVKRPSVVSFGTRVTVLWPNSPKVKPGRRQARFLTTRRHLHLAQPAFEPVRHLGRRDRFRGRADVIGLDALAAERADLGALVQC